MLETRSSEFKKINEMFLKLPTATTKKREVSNNALPMDRVPG
jgi:hypothetical protein